MKKISLFLFLIIAALQIGFAQKIGYFDSKFVLEKIPEYKKAQDELKNVTKKWQDEVNAKFAYVEELKKAYRAEEILLTEDMRKERSDTIDAREKAAIEYRKKIFGFEGMLFLKRQELIKPLQDKVFDAVEKVCRQKRIAIMFDKSGELVMIYTDPRHDYTDFVLEELGLGDKDDTVDNPRNKKFKGKKQQEDKPENKK
jgi:outer membrane protein